MMTSLTATQPATVSLLCAGLLFSSTAQAEGNVFPPSIEKPNLSLDVSTLPASAVSRPTLSTGSPHNVEVRLLSDHSTVSPGQEIRLGLWLEQDEGWHTYWKSPGSIGKPTTVEWRFSIAEGNIAEDLDISVSDLQFPLPTKFDQSGILSYGYEDYVLLSATATLPETLQSDRLVVQANVEWLVCKESCIPGETSVSLPLSIGASEKSVHAPLFERVQDLHPSHPIDIQDITVETISSVNHVLPESTFTYAIKVSPTGKKSLSFDPENAWPLFTPITGDWWWINEQRIQKTEDGGLLIQIDGESFEAEQYPTIDKIGGLIQLQVDGEWVQFEIQSPLSLLAKGSTIQEVSSPLLQKEGADAQEKTPTETETSMVEAKAVIAAPAEKSIVEALLLAFFGGMLLNIMPCVLPVLSLKLFGLIEQSGISSRAQKVAGLAYAAGIISSFLLLALVVILLQTSFGLNIGWGFQFQYPGYVIALATIVFVFGLSLLGVFEIPTIGANKAHELSQREGWVEYFMIGVFATLLATPCSAPFLGTGIGFALTLPPMGILLFFGIAGLGLAFPFLLVAFIPAFFKILPQPGAWMETFKHIMGFSLMGTTVWLVDVLGAQTGVAGVTGFLSYLTVVGLGSWIFGTWGSIMATTRNQILSFLVAVGLSTGAGFAFLTTEFTEASIATELSSAEELDFATDIPWQPFSDANIATLKRQNKAIFIDFTADWCLSCKVNEKNVLETNTIREAMKTNGIVPVKADWTRRDDEISRWLKEYGKAGVPFYLFIDAKGVAHPLPEVLTTGLLLDVFNS